MTRKDIAFTLEAAGLPAQEARSLSTTLPSAANKIEMWKALSKQYAQKMAQYAVQAMPTSHLEQEQAEEAKAAMVTHLTHYVTTLGQDKIGEKGNEPIELDDRITRRGFLALSIRRER